MSQLSILSILDARVITGPTRGLIHLARYLPRNAWLHIAVLSPTADTPLPPIAEVAGAARLTVHRLVEGSSYDPRVVLRARDIARDVGAHVIQSHSYKPHVVALGVRALTDTPWIAFHHGWTAENLKVRLFHGVDRFTLPRADRIVAVSNPSRELVLGVGCPSERTAMITNAVDARDVTPRESRDALRAALSLPHESIVACAVGRLSHEKGQDVLLRAFARTTQEAPGLVLALAGDGPDRAALESLTRELNIAERVRFLGHQPEVSRVYGASDILVLPSRSEGMPNVLLEAMSLGMPCIATRVGGVSEVATHGETAWLVASEDVDALHRALVHAATSPDERARRGRLAQQFAAATLSPIRRVERFNALYADLLSNRWSPASSRDTSEPQALHASI